MLIIWVLFVVLVAYGGFMRMTCGALDKMATLKAIFLKTKMILFGYSRRIKKSTVRAYKKP